MYDDKFWEDYLADVEDSAYWKVSVGSMVNVSFDYRYIMELERIADLPVSERQDALSRIFMKQGCA